MDVKELIEKLKKVRNKKKEVFITDSEGGYKLIHTHVLEVVEQDEEVEILG